MPIQNEQVITQLGKFLHVKICMALAQERVQRRLACHLIVGIPGNLIYLVKRRTLDFRSIKVQKKRLVPGMRLRLVIKLAVTSLEGACRGAIGQGTALPTTISASDEHLKALRGQLQKFYLNGQFIDESLRPEAQENTAQQHVVWACIVGRNFVFSLLVCSSAAECGNIVGATFPQPSLGHDALW